MFRFKIDGEFDLGVLLGIVAILVAVARVVATLVLR